MTTEKYERTYRVAIVVFLLLCSFPLWGLLLPAARQTDTTENRTLAAWPSAAPLENLPAGIEAYFNDHLAFRSKGINLYNFVLFNLGASNLDWILIGKEKWLYFTANSSLEDLQRQIQFTEEQLATICAYEQAMADTMAALGADYYVMYASDKHTIYPEYLPDNIRTGEGASRLEQYQAALAANTTVQFFTTQDALLAAKSEDDVLFSRTDTHWNRKGAFIAYSELMRQLAKKHPTLRVLTQDDYIITEQATKGGDMAQLANLVGYFNDTDYTFTPRFQSEVVEIEQAPAAYDDLATVHIYENPTAPDAPTCVMFRDSFTNNMEEFIKESFSRVVLVSSLKILTPIVQAEQPDIVVCEHAERYTELIMEIAEESSTPSH